MFESTPALRHRVLQHRYIARNLRRCLPENKFVQRAPYYAGVPQSWRARLTSHPPLSLAVRPADGIPGVQVGTLERIRDALEAEGIEFAQTQTASGVRLRRRQQ